MEVGETSLEEVGMCSGKVEEETSLVEEEMNSGMEVVETSLEEVGMCSGMVERETS
jgi:hypothetical protein